MGEETQDSSLSKLDSSQLEMMKEMCLVVDENDKVIDSVSKIDCHRGKGIRHRAFSHHPIYNYTQIYLCDYNPSWMKPPLGYLTLGTSSFCWHGLLLQSHLHSHFQYLMAEKSSI